MRACRAVVSLALVAAAAPAIYAAGPPSRLRAGANFSSRAPLPQGVSRRVETSQLVGAVDGNAELGLMSLVLAPSAQQTAALDKLLADQQNAASPQFHKWLTPAQFGEQFGVSDADLQVLQNWLTTQGFTVVSVAPSRNLIQFTGTAAAAQTAFGTGFSRFQRNGQTFFSNTSAPSIPAAFQSVVSGVQGLDSYRLQSKAKKRVMTAEERQSVSPDLTATTSAGAVVHLLAPYDVRQIYSANALVSSGFTGTGVTIAVIGQTAVNTTQLANFQTITGQTVKAPTLTLVPNSGTSTIYAGDEGEAESDIEFSGGVAPGATINYVYTGNGTGTIKNPDVITALEYAITANVGQIITLSYGSCEPFGGTSYIYTVEPYLRQASAQGQTFAVASGDSGAGACDSDAVPSSYDGVAVSYPASSPFATGVGGTTFAEGTGTYWSATNNSQRGSALGYIPETAWNESSSSGLGASGGGSSVVFSKPSWQTGTGVPSDGARDVPDISFAAASGHDPYIVCTADTTFSGTSGGTTYTGQCSTTALGAFVIGGTSLGTPSFAGLLALAEQANGGGRLGNINPSLYSLAATTPAVFNDVTTGSNQIACIAGVIGCVNGLAGYTAGAGYDRATGLGSLNMGNFATAITAVTTANAKTPTFVVTPVTQTATIATFALQVGSGNSSTVPTGTVSVSLDGGTASSVTLVSGAATFSVSLMGVSAGTHTVVATYSGDGNYSASKTSSSFVIVSGTAAFSLTATPTTLAVVSGSTGTGGVSLTSTNYTGLVLYGIAPASGSAAAPGCFIGANGDFTSSGNTVFLDTSITSGSTVTAAFTYHSLATDCGTASNIVPSKGSLTGQRGTSHDVPWAAFAFGGCVLGGLTLRRRKMLGGGLLAIAFTVAVLGASGCGNGSAPLSGTTTTTTTTPTGGTVKTYNYVITAQSYPNTTVSTTTNFTLTVQ